MAETPTVGPLSFERTFNAQILTKRQRELLEEKLLELESATLATRQGIINQLRRQLGSRFEKIFEDGMVIYKDGKRVPINTWADMYARTSSMDTMRSAQVSFSKDNGMDLLVIKNDPTPCPLCIPWNEQIVSISGESTEYPSLDDAKSDLWGHPNCECIVLGLTPDQVESRRR